ncbi:hypothetical protein TNCV_3562331 [Trichonephila clavipes]|nr:hypothetical protein TNCV_3562331 [Trichonephila clavipes]
MDSLKCRCYSYTFDLAMVDSACTLRSISKVYIGVFPKRRHNLMFNAAQEKPSFLHYGDGNTERRDGSQRTPITSSREKTGIYHMALMNRAATSRALRQELGSFARQQVSTRTVR